MIKESSDGNLSSSSRINLIRAKQYSSKGEKVTFIQRDLSQTRMSVNVRGLNTSNLDYTDGNEGTQDLNNMT